MVDINLYGEVKNWKKPMHLSKAVVAKSYLKLFPNLKIIGITGSVGKTLTQNAVVSVISQKFKVVSGEENLDPTFRIPKTILKAKPWSQAVILEYGVEHPGEMSAYLKIAKPEVAVVTNIAPTHLRYFKNIHGIFDEKSKLVSALPKNGFAILNADDPHVAKMANLTVAKVMLFGKKAKDGIKISHFSESLKGATFRLHYKGQKATANWKIVGEHQLTSAYAAATVGLAMGLTVKQIAKGLSQSKSPAHRLNPILTKTFSILDDTYNSSPLAVQESVKTLLALGKNKKKVLVLGEMRDQGDSSVQIHKKIGQFVAKTNINTLITIGKTAKIISDEVKKTSFKGKTLNFSTTKSATSQLKKLNTKNTLILVKGSRHEHLDRIVLGLTGKSTSINCYHCGRLD